jgi:hypothetical protein
MPTTQPTSAPTSQPTPLDIIDLNMFTAPITPEIVSKKVNYYLGSFVAYFIACFIILVVADYLRLGKAEVKQLYDSAYSSSVFIPSSSRGDLPSGPEGETSKHDRVMRNMVLNKLKSMDKQLIYTIEDEKRFVDLSEQSGRVTRDKSIAKGNTYSAGFHVYIDQRRAYLGCKPLWYPGGQVTACRSTWTLQESAVEDFVLYECNNHSVLSCVLSCDGAQVDRTGKRLIYIAQNAIAFCFNAISGSAFNYFGFSSRANILFEFFVTVPATIAIAKVMRLLYVCPIGFSVEYQVVRPRLVACLRSLGKLAIVPIITGIGGLLVTSAVFSRGYNIYIIVIYFFLEVQVYSFFLEFLLGSLLMFPSQYYRINIDLYVKQVVVLEVGRRFVELLHHQGLVTEGKDYYLRSRRFLFFFLIDYICLYNEAVKKGYVRDPSVVVEMQSTSIMHDGVSVDEEDPLALFDVYNANRINTDVINPMFERANLFKSNDKNGEMRAGMARMRQDTPVSADVELYKIYEEDSVRNIGMGDDISSEAYDFTENVLSFEDWKVNRKKFKEGTRGSFVKAFQVFEDLYNSNSGEGSSIPSSFSNTVHLHDANIKANPLLKATNKNVQLPVVMLGNTVSLSSVYDSAHKNSIDIISMYERDNVLKSNEETTMGHERQMRNDKPMSSHGEQSVSPDDVLYTLYNNESVRNIGTHDINTKAVSFDEEWTGEREETPVEDEDNDLADQETVVSSSIDNIVRLAHVKKNPLLQHMSKNIRSPVVDEDNDLVDQETVVSNSVDNIVRLAYVK